MITKEQIEKQRTPKELREFVIDYIQSVKNNKNERHKAFSKKGAYKEFIDELIPLSVFSDIYYPLNDVNISLIMGNQSYDAIAKKNNEIIDKIEITTPHDGLKNATLYKQVVMQGHSDSDFYKPGDDLKRLIPHIINTCHKKAEKNYLECLLVISIDYLTPYPEHEYLYLSIINKIKSEINMIDFNAKNVFFLEMQQ